VRVDELFLSFLAEVFGAGQGGDGCAEVLGVLLRADVAFIAGAVIGGAAR